MSVASTDLSAASTNIFEPIQKAIKPLMIYQSVLERMALSPMLLSTQEATLLKSLSCRVLELDVSSLCKELESIMSLNTTTRELSQVESQTYTLLKTLLVSKKITRSAMCMVVNLDLLINALNESPKIFQMSGDLTAVTSEPVPLPKGVKPPAKLAKQSIIPIDQALKFPKVAASLALLLLKEENVILDKQLIGKGAFGSVYQTTINGSSYAIKESGVPTFAQKFIEGAKLGIVTQSCHFVELACILDNMVVMEKGSIDLYDASIKHKGSLLISLPRYTRELITGLSYLHNVAGIIHHDIKPENIVFVRDRLNPTILHAKYIDFDLMKRSGTQHNKVDGTLVFLSPEVCHQHQNIRRGAQESLISLPAYDIWALGITLYQVLSDFTWLKPECDPKNTAAFFSQILSLSQNDVNQAIHALSSNHKMIQYLGGSKFRDTIIQRGIPLAQKILIEEATQAGHEGSPQDLLSIGIQGRIDFGGEDGLMKFVAKVGAENFISEHSREKYEALRFDYGKKEFEHLHYILTGFLQIDPDKRLTAEAALSYYLDLDRGEDRVSQFFEIGVLVSTSNEEDPDLSQGPQKRVRESSRSASTVGSTSAESSATPTSDSSSGRPTPSPN
jgi:serine/threonine protein kinase